MATELLEVSIDIAAPPSRVWPVIADLRSMSRRSPQNRWTYTRGPVRRGSLLFNINRIGPLWVPTTSRVVTFDPGRKLAFTILENRATWIYTLEPLDGGTRTRVVEQRRVPSGRTTRISRLLVKVAQGGNERFEADLVAGMNQTLAALKAEIEAAAAP